MAARRQQHLRREYSSSQATTLLGSNSPSYFGPTTPTAKDHLLGSPTPYTGPKRTFSLVRDTKNVLKLIDKDISLGQGVAADSAYIPHTHSPDFSGDYHIDAVELAYFTAATTAIDGPFPGRETYSAILVRPEGVPFGNIDSKEFVTADNGWDDLKLESERFIPDVFPSWVDNDSQKKATAASLGKVVKAWIKKTKRGFVIRLRGREKLGNETLADVHMFSEEHQHWVASWLRQTPADTTAPKASFDLDPSPALTGTTAYSPQFGGTCEDARSTLWPPQVAESANTEVVELEASASRAAFGQTTSTSGALSESSIASRTSLSRRPSDSSLASHFIPPKTPPLRHSNSAGEISHSSRINRRTSNTTRGLYDGKTPLNSPDATENSTSLAREFSFAASEGPSMIGESMPDVSSPKTKAKKSHNPRPRRAPKKTVRRVNSQTAKLQETNSSPHPVDTTLHAELDPDIDGPRHSTFQEELQHVDTEESLNDPRTKTQSASSQYWAPDSTATGKGKEAGRGLVPVTSFAETLGEVSQLVGNCIVQLENLGSQNKLGQERKISPDVMSPQSCSRTSDVPVDDYFEERTTAYSPPHSLGKMDRSQNNDYGELSVMGSAHFESENKLETDQEEIANAAIAYGEKIQQARNPTAINRIRTYIRLITDSTFTLTLAILSLLLDDNARSAIPKDHVRVRWTCKCGKELFDDFIENRPGAARLLEQHLNRPRQHAGGVNGGSSSSSTPSSPSGSSLRTQASTAATSIDPGDISLQRPLSSRNPYTPILSAKGSSMTLDTGPFLEQLWILACAEREKFTTKLIHLDATSQKVKSDMELARLIKDQYSQLRPGWRQFLRPRGLSTIQFVQFELHRTSVVDIRKCPDVPTKMDNDYTFFPSDLIPPVGSHYLMHLFHHAEDYEDELITYKRIPKKRGVKLRVPDREDTCMGWGIHLVEGFLPHRIWTLLTSFFGFVSFVFAVAWSVKKGDIQGAFGIAAYVAAMGTLVLGCCVAYLE